MEDLQQTRLIVKNLPKHCDDKRLRDHFGAKGNVTDARVARSKEGKSRLFGFVGFATEEDAKRALSYFNSTFLDTSRIQVDVARPKGDPTIPRPWSKHAPGSSGFEKKGGVPSAAVMAPSDQAPAGADGKRGVKRPRAATSAATAGKNAVSEAASSASGPTAAGSAPPRKLGRSGATEDTEKEEFMAAMKRRSQAKFWTNDAAEVEAVAEPELGKLASGASSGALRGEGNEGEGTSSSDGDSDAEDRDEILAATVGSAASAEPPGPGVSDMDWLRSRKVASLSAAAVGATSKGTPAVIAAEDDDTGSSEEDDSADDGEDASANGGDVRKSSVAAAAAPAAPSAAAAGNAEGVGAADGAMDEEDEASGRLFVRNLPFDCSEEDLQTLFGSFGVVSEAHLPLDDLGRGKGFAFVQFLLPENAENAREALDRRPFKGRLLHILPARAQPGGGGGGGGGSGGAAAAAAGGTYKARKEAERRVAATENTGWNSAFVRSDTVVDALAHRLGVAKGEVLDREEGDMAVRLALGETQLIRENREYFEREGVDLSALESATARASNSSNGGSSGGSGKAERSDTVILVKNLPFSTEVGELAALFGAHGSVSRVLLPPSHTVALVEFSAAGDAKRAFKRIAYKRFQHVPLYLEWAPVKVFARPATAAAAAATAAAAAAGAAANAAKNSSAAAAAAAAATAAAAAAAGRKFNADDSAVAESNSATGTAEVMAGQAAAGAREAAVAAVTGVDEDAAAAGGDSSEANTIYVKNLSFATTEENLKKAFGVVAGLRAVAIPRKRAVATAAGAGSGSGGGLSMGFGFAEFASAAAVEEALKRLQGCMLDGHALQLKRSTKRLTAKTPAAAAAGSGAAAAAARRTKVIVRNVAFQATAKEIRELFSAYGRVKRVRLPKKFDGGHRGFAFVEYALPREAADAFQALASTHLYGRHLVLEWAAEDADGVGNVEALQAKAAKEARAVKAYSGAAAVSAAAGLAGDKGFGFGGKKTVFDSDGEEEAD